ncbi:unnamed protein product [Linum trigynum]|uniref:F-box domain-containing protein n=1 Tax=Linum trigynum TaxID=586398 RepID=A0AAV2F5U8_9ROSI
MSIQNPNKKIRIEGEAEEPQIDRLSSLPDHVLHHVLSFFDDTLFSVRTSVLSSRWRSLWKHVPRLTLDTDFFNSASSFARYVDGVLSSRLGGSNVDEINFFHLRFSLDKELFQRVVKFAASSNCQELIVCVGYDEILEPHLFVPLADSNLRRLRFRCSSLGTGFGSCAFSALRVLDLDDCCLPCGSAADLDPFANFPCLENLTLCGCAMEDRQCCFKISGPRLVKLQISALCCSKLEIFAPELKFFDITDIARSPILYQLALPSLDHGIISVHDNGRVEKNKEEMKASCISLLQGLHNASSLNVHSHFLELLSSNYDFLEDQSSPFTRLKSLKVSPYFPEFHYMLLSYHVIKYFMKGSSRHGPETIEFV